MQLEEVSVDIKGIGGMLGRAEYELRLPMEDGSYNTLRMDDDDLRRCQETQRDNPVNLDSLGSMKWWYQGRFYVGPDDYEQIDLKLALWEKHQEKQRIRTRTDNEIVLHTCPVCLRGPVVQEHSVLARLATGARLVCEECGSVLEEKRGIYRYKRISPNYPQDLLTGRFHSLEELSDQDETSIKPIKEYQAKRQRLAAEKEVERRLQPVTLGQFFGQPRIREQVGVAIAAARARGRALGHVLLCGPEHCGKRSLAKVIANEMHAKTNWLVTPGDLQKPLDVRSWFAMVTVTEQLLHGDTLFIDDIHKLRSSVEELLRPIMQDFILHKLAFPRFTIIAATDQPNRVSPKLRRCFQHVYEFEPYDDVALGHLVQRRAEVLGIDIEDEGCWELGRGAKGVIRQAERLLDRARDYATVKADGVVTLEIAQWAVHGTAPTPDGSGAEPLALTWQEFEDFVAKLFSALGYEKVRLTPRAGDEGKDIVMEWADPLRGSRRLYVECKHWRASSVGRRDIQVLHSAVMANPAVDEGVLVTSGRFTDGAVDYAKQVGVIQLIDRNNLRELMTKAGMR